MINLLYDLTLIYAASYIILSFVSHIYQVFTTSNQQDEPPMTPVRIPPKANNLAAPLEDEKARTLLDASYSIRQLKKLASDAHVKNYGSMNKQQLLEVLGV